MALLKKCYCFEKKHGFAEQPEETGFDRIYRIYTLNQYGLLSPELFYLWRGAYTAVALSAVCGGIYEMIQAKNDYMRRNIASTYESQYLAKRHFTDSLTLAGFRGALKHAMKYGSFTTVYMFSTMTISYYNNKISMWEHMGTGFFLGGICRFKYGPRGMLAAGCLGGFLGFVLGGSLTLSLWLTGTSLQDLTNSQYQDYIKHLDRQSKKSS